ncbi:hypothetical protein CEXT_612841 [Caerostris extrusa]|uniref:Uncharacterized protein n=1 Tax=Caerostris extrusa TaxID=172846 RepID=A0AAV4T374_CAEEX|nr:hypothetical protein CEXT_612841 [Caerostris extrusa]
MTYSEARNYEKLVCVGILQLNSMYIKGKLFEKFTYTKLRIFMYGAALLWVITLAGSTYYLLSAVRLEQGFYPEKMDFTSPSFLAAWQMSFLCGWSTIPENS